MSPVRNDNDTILVTKEDLVLKLTELILYHLTAQALSTGY